VNDSAIDSAKNELLPVLLQNINSVTVPDIHDTLGPKILNNSVSLTDITLGNFNINVDNSNLDFKGEGIVALTLTNLGASGSADFAYTAALLKGSGTA